MNLSIVKPAFILLVAIIFFGRTIYRYVEAKHKTYPQVNINNPKLDTLNSPVELSGFVFKQQYLDRQDDGIAIYASSNDTVPVAVLAVKKKEEFLREFKDRGKVVVEHFDGEISTLTDKGIQDFVSIRDFVQPKKAYLPIFKYIPLQTTKWLLIELGGIGLLIVFLGLIVLSRIRLSKPATA